MISGNNRNQMRQYFSTCWRMKNTGQAMDAMQKIISNIIELHPEYHALIEDKSQLDKDFSADQGASNPFLHMSMHISLHEQISIDRPAGIKQCYEQLCQQSGSAHEAEHAMMECLGESLWQAQRDQSAPNEVEYLQCLQNLANITIL